MLCRACGMDSRTTDFCEWCKRPLAPQPGTQPTLGMPAGAPPAPRPPRVTLTGEVLPEETPGQGAYPPPNAPLPSSQTAYAPNTPLAATMQVNPMAVTPQMVQQQFRETEESLADKRERFLAIGLPILILSMLLVHFAPAAFLWVALADLFILSLVMGATGAIPSYDDAFADCAVMLVVCYLFGPLIALVIYWVVGLVRQEWNAAILGLLEINLAVRILLGIAFPASGSTLAMGAIFALFGILGFFAVCVSFAGWMLSSFFRPLNE